MYVHEYGDLRRKFDYCAIMAIGAMYIYKKNTNAFLKRFLVLKTSGHKIHLLHRTAHKRQLQLRSPPGLAVAVTD